MKEEYGGWATAYRQHCWWCLSFISHRTFRQGVEQKGEGIASQCACGVGWCQPTFWLYSADCDLEHCLTRHRIYGNTHEGSKPWSTFTVITRSGHFIWKELKSQGFQPNFTRNCVILINGSHNCICRRWLQNRSRPWKVKGGPKQKKAEIWSKGGLLTKREHKKILQNSKRERMDEIKFNNWQIYQVESRMKKNSSEKQWDERGRECIGVKTWWERDRTAMQWHMESKYCWRKETT